MSDASEIIAGRPQVRTFTDDTDEDWAWFTVASAGNYTITAVGEMPSLDTYIELYDDDGDSIDENDDGGDSYDARLRVYLVYLRPGKYYILVTTLDDFSDPESYTLNIRN